VVRLATGTGVVVLAVCLALLTGMSTAASSSAATSKVETCGLLPGEGAFNYVKVWNMRCGKARKVADQVLEDFCGPQFQRCSVDVEDVIRGRERYRDWRCGVTVAWEFVRVRCERNGKRFVQASGA
jgi:hypothetical protein